MPELLFSDDFIKMWLGVSPKGKKEMTTNVTFSTVLQSFRNVFLSSTPPEIAIKLGLRTGNEEFSNKWRAMNQIASALVAVSPEEIETVSEKHYIRSVKMETNDDVVRAVTELLLYFKSKKEARSEGARNCAVVYTLLEQVLAYVVYYLK